MLNPVFFVSRALLVGLAATFLVVAAKAIAYLLNIDQTVSDMVIGVLFAAGLAFAGVRYGHQHAKKSTTPLSIEARLFLILFALFLFILSALRFDFLGSVVIAGSEVPAAGIFVPAAVAIWVVYWCMKNVLSISTEQAAMVGTTRWELLTLCAGILLAPFLLLIPGFALADVFGFDAQIIFAVFQYAPIMSASLPAAFSVRKLITHSG